MKQLDPATTSSIVDAVARLERRSCAEVVVEVRARSGRYAQTEARFASLCAFVALLVLLFSPWTFAPLWVAIDVALVWFAALFAARRSDAVRRLMTSEAERGEQTRSLAAAVFHERGVAGTDGETGVLLYLSLMEGRLELLADRGVLEQVPALEWNRIAEEARAKHATTATLLEVIVALEALLERHLPAGEGDTDELCNQPRFVVE